MTSRVQVKYHEISLGIGERIIQHTDIVVNDYAKTYDSTVLKKYDLEPRYMLEIDNTVIFISRIFWGKRDTNIQSGRPHAILYIENGHGSFIARNFYRSRSQNVWRLLPGVFKYGHYYKSPYGEQAINAPIELQKILDELHIIHLSHPSRMSDCFPYEDIGSFGGDNTDDFDDAFGVEMQEYPWMGFVEKTSRSLLRPPKELVLNPDDSPLFSRELMSWQDVYDNTKRVFISKNGRLKYEFLTDKRGRSCLALIECADAKINSFGLRNQFVQTGDFTTPLYEYLDQTEGTEITYGDLDDKLYSYYGMWRRYLSQIPLIREYTDYLHSQGNLTADRDDAAGQIEEDKICEIFRKILEKEPLMAQEMEFMCRPSEQFLYPMTVKNAKNNLRSVIQKRERLKATFLDTKRMDSESLAKRLIYIVQHS